jgi:hypothetical protein
MFEKFGAQIAALIFDAPLPLAVLIGAVAGFVWWLRSYIGKERVLALHERIKTLEERLRLGTDKQNTLTEKIETLERKVSTLTKQVEQKQPIEVIAQTTFEVAGTVQQVSVANTVLGSTLSRPVEQSNPPQHGGSVSVSKSL